MRSACRVWWLICMVIGLLVPATVRGDVVVSQSGGFQLSIQKKTKADPQTVFQTLVQDIDQWWSSDHTYSGSADNLSMDLERHCFLEQLPDGGFVRHLEIVYFKPGSAIRLTGGLGPLQEMGVHGALTIQLSGDQATGETEIQVSYNVIGLADPPPSLQMDKIAPAVDQVVTEQIRSLAALCDQRARKK